eukprot:TRINITY_DN1646_c0_g1_i3.p1 TRINITY_DN1646_c0_g1~~TRINITY_DN1646_c0_g1_i3.p1  ORF type:complete len:282 (-),score=53.50 TRINITY_DN1646_c0_g1_i3:388-1233(-)
MFLYLFVFLHTVVTERITIEFHSPTEDCHLFAESMGLKYLGTVGILDWAHEFEFVQEKRGLTWNLVLERLEHLMNGEKRGEVPVVKWFQEDKARTREKRVVITDPEYPRQWHLHGSSLHLNTETAWDKGYMGEGVRIAIVDDGIQTTHPDLADNARVDSSWNFNENKQDPNPTYMNGPSGDWHGTASAGAAAARDDGKSCGVGVAPRAELAGLAILQNNVEVGDAVEAKALGFMNQDNHIYSNSWGPIQPGMNGHLNEAPGRLLQAVIEKAGEGLQWEAYP